MRTQYERESQIFVDRNIFFSVLIFIKPRFNFNGIHFMFLNISMWVEKDTCTETFFLSLWKSYCNKPSAGISKGFLILIPPTHCCIFYRWTSDQSNSGDIFAASRITHTVEFCWKITLGNWSQSSLRSKKYFFSVVWWTQILSLSLGCFCNIWAWYFGVILMYQKFKPIQNNCKLNKISNYSVNIIEDKK